MKIIQLSIEQGKSMYGKSKEMDELLLANFTKEELKPFDWHDIKIIEDAQIATGHTPEYMTKYLGELTDEWAYRMLKMVAKAINQGWSPDWSNGSQYKYYPWFEVLSSGFGFSGSGCFYANATTTVGSRLCFESSEKAKYAGTQFIDLYKQFLL